jgi:hypothetical protein
VIAWNLPRGVRMVGAVSGSDQTSVILHLAKHPPQVMQFAQAIHQGRAARGKALLRVAGDERVVGLTVPRKNTLART